MSDAHKPTHSFATQPDVPSGASRASTGQVDSEGNQGEVLETFHVTMVVTIRRGSTAESEALPPLQFNPTLRGPV